MQAVKSAIQAVLPGKTEQTSTAMAFPHLPEWSKTQTMRCLRFHGARDVRIETHPRPLITHPGDAIVRVLATTVCGSDLHLYNNSFPGMHPGDILGHEAVGVVHQVGLNVELPIGQRVVVSAVIACGDCRYCKEGRYSVCDHTNPSAEMEKLFGHRCAALLGYSHVTGGYPGTQAEYVRVPNANLNLLPIPDELDDERALSLSDIACTGWHACMMGEVQEGSTVGVWGCGPVGLMTIMHAKRLGAKRIISVDCVPERLAKAAELGAETIDDSHVPDGRTIPEQFLHMMPGGADVTIEAVGFRYSKSILERVECALGMATDSIDALVEAMRSCRKGGTIAVVGDFVGVCNSFPIGAFMELNQTMRGGQLHTQQYWPRLLKDLLNNEFDPRRIYTHRVQLDDLPRVYRMMDEKLDGCIKAVVRVGELQASED